MTARSTVKAAMHRIARFQTIRVYSYEVAVNAKTTKRAGVRKIGA